MSCALHLPLSLDVYKPSFTFPLERHFTYETGRSQAHATGKLHNTVRNCWVLIRAVPE